MAIELDQKDKIILYLLDRNARMPLTKIAKQVKLSRESVLYRINNYFKSGLLYNYLTVVDSGKLGYTHYKVDLKLSNITKEKELEFIYTLVKNPNVSWVASCDGIYDLIYAIKARSSLELSNILNKINANYWQYIKQQDFATIISGQIFYRDYLIKDLKKKELNTITKDEIKWTEATELKELDLVDKIILEELTNNARATAVQIAKKAKVSPDTILLRIKKLEQQKIIVHYTIWPNLSNLIGHYYKVLIRAKNISPNLDKEIQDYCRKEPNIYYTPKVFGPWQYEIDIEAKDSEQLREIMRAFTNKFESNIVDYNTLDIYKEYKFKFFDIDVFKEEKQERKETRIK
jgi:Lrp/AsnC family leucine-responsive transcriptional regulator